MDYREVDSTSEYVCRLAHGADWRGEIEAFADEQGIDAGFFYGLGAVQDAELMFYDQDRTEYDSLTFDEPLEVAACMGNISQLDGERFAHTHAVLSRPDGEAIAGHLNAGTVWAGELYVRGFDTALEREHDEPTDLDLWNI
ncbi:MULTISPECIES: PPC domain-containing DNA-binding protein [Haloarcula]|uniref:PolA operon protein (DNA-binding protein) n=1 Tax=Haloarcula amylolytica JCM 13557 TaxID=1227452 RepID=M0KXD7_9EURY|nr:PPC domain-containing DNA-binding protein [Haloarcula amylolytica]EMA25937.1 polA operon protein (DNA-binding protein) [Haloarcula amylolytica JCM 13557]